MYQKDPVHLTLVLPWGEGNGWRRLLEEAIKSEKTNRREFSRGLLRRKAFQADGRAKAEVTKSEVLETLG